jgi:predicted ATPase/DNA-binding XRE family transcriptional regulator
VATAESETFGTLLRRFRLAAGLSQEALAEFAELSVTGIQALERGRRTTPRLSTIDLLAKGLALSARDRALLLNSATGELARSPADSGGLLPLPESPTALVGRDQALAQVASLLDSHRLVTLTGPGGVGKTRLAIAAAATHANAYADGVAFVDLSALRDHRLLAATVARAVGLREARGHKLEESLVEHLRRRQLLLVVDNFEQVLPGGALVAKLLALCRRLSVMTTSRVALRLRGEQIYPVHPLSLPNSGVWSNPTELVNSGAVTLFVERARDVRWDFSVTSRNAPLLAEICYRLDGLPLAIELAAAHARALPLRTLLDHLNNPLDILVDGAQDLPDRQRTLRATLDWSYRLLSETQQALFRRLGAFAGGCSPESAQAVCDPASELSFEAVDGLEKLVDQSLLRQQGLSEDLARFIMLGTVREYALTQLRQSGELSTVLQRHSRYFLSFAEAAIRELQGPAQREWLERLEIEHDNLRVALSEPVEDAGSDLRPELAATLWPFWVARGHLAEGRGHAERLLGLDGSNAGLVRARLLNGAGVLAWHQGDYNVARLHLVEGLGLSSKCGCDGDSTSAEALKWLGNTSTMTGRPSEALEYYERSCALYEKVGDNSGIINARANLGIIYRRTGRYSDALREAKQCLAMRERMGHTWGVASSHNNIGEIYRSQGEPDVAIPSYEQAVAVWESVEDALGIAVGLTGLGIARVEAGDRVGGLANLLDAEVRFKALHSTAYLPELHRYLAAAALARGDLDAATREATRSLELGHAAGASDQAAITERTLGQIALVRGDLQSAQQFLEASRHTLAEAGELGELARTQALLRSVLSSSAAVEEPSSLTAEPGRATPSVLS